MKELNNGIIASQLAIDKHSFILSKVKDTTWADIASTLRP